MNVELAPEVLFKDKGETKEAIDNYKIVNGYYLNFTKSDPTRI